MITIPNEIVFEEVKKAIRNGEKITIPLRGTSMLPTLHDGDFVTLEPCDCKRKFNRNNVLLFSYHDACILHRFYHFENEMIVTRGDNLYSYEKFPKENVIAILSSYKNENNVVINCNSMRWLFLTIKLPFARLWKKMKSRVKRIFIPKLKPKP